MRQISIYFFFIITLSPTTLWSAQYRDIGWEELIPPSELEILERMAAQIDHDSLPSAVIQAMDPDIQGVMNSINVRPELNKQDIRIPGYIVPLEVDEKNAIIEFFLVPYFGACIHVPPPPPNQIIFVRYEKGLDVQEIWMPFFISGTLHTELLENDMAAAAYTMVATEIKEYEAQD